MDDRSIAALIHALSPARISRYEAYSGTFGAHYIELYHYNILVAQEINFSLSILEVVLRNRINWIFVHKYGFDWPYSDRLLRTLRDRHAADIVEVRDRQQTNRGLARVDHGMVVADLPLGFWVSLFAMKYQVSLGWRPDGNLRRIFPNDTPTDLVALHSALDRLRILRNRIAHHEPILHLDLPHLHGTVMALLSAMCRDTADFVAARCRFFEVWRR